MLPASCKVWGIGIKDRVDFNIANGSKRSGKIEGGAERASRLELFVDTDQADFHSSQWKFWELTPHPEEMDIPYQTYREAVVRLMNQKPKINDSLLTDFYAIRDKRKRIHHKTYPLLIYNPSKSPVNIQKSTDSELLMILEAKDKEGEWKPIEYVYQRGGFVCGTGHTNYVLPPESFMVATFKRYQGSFRTQLRVKLKSFDQTFYSNSFEDEIHYGQFNQDPVVNDLVHRFASRDIERIKSRIRAAFLDY